MSAPATPADSLPAELAVTYFDGVSAQAQAAWLSRDGAGLRLRGEGLDRRLRWNEVDWPERTRHGPRLALLHGGGTLQAQDAAAWDRWLRAAGRRESLVVRAQQHWRATLLASALLIVLCGAGYVWGLPVAARLVLGFVPPAADRAIGDAALRSLEGSWLRPSALPEAAQERWRAAFARAVARTYPEAARPAYDLRFYASPAQGFGTNAFALPGGTIVVTDAMLALFADREPVVLGVLGHELGHVQRRHGMRLVVQAALLGTLSTLAWGDASSLLATAPVLLGQARYSRAFESEADESAIELLRANGLSPAVMVELFERLAAQRAETEKGAEKEPGKAADKAAGKEAGPGLPELGIALASHPADAERIARFRAAAARP